MGRAPGHEIVGIAADTKSGTVAPWDRPKLRPWVTDPSKMAMYDGVLAYKNDRLSRGVWADEARIRLWAEEHGKRLVIVDGPQWPPRHDGDKWAWEVQAMQARMEWEDGRERSMRAQGELRDRGKLVGRPSFGYAVTGTKYDHTLAPTDEGREWVPRIFGWVIDGHSLATIAKRLDSAGVRPVSGVKWWPRTLAGLIRNTTYTGRRADAGGKVIHKCEPLVDSVTFRRANESLAGRPKRGPQNTADRAMLAESLICPACSWSAETRMPTSPLYRIKSFGGAFYYRCSGRGSQRRGCGNMIPLIVVDDLVSRFMLNFDAPIMTERLVPGHAHKIEFEDIRVEMRALASRDLSDDEYDSELARLRAERDRLAALPSVPDGVEWIATGQTHAEEWESLSEAERGAWLRSKGIRVYLSKSRELVETVFPGPLAQFMAGAHVVDYGTGVSAVITIAGSGSTPRPNWRTD